MSVKYFGLSVKKSLLAVVSLPQYSKLYTPVPYRKYDLECPEF